MIMNRSLWHLAGHITKTRKIVRDVASGDNDPTHSSGNGREVFWKERPLTPGEIAYEQSRDLEITGNELVYFQKTMVIGRQHDGTVGTTNDDDNSQDDDTGWVEMDFLNASWAGVDGSRPAIRRYNGHVYLSGHIRYVGGGNPNICQIPANPDGLNPGNVAAVAYTSEIRATTEMGGELDVRVLNTGRAVFIYSGGSSATMTAEAPNYPYELRLDGISFLVASNPPGAEPTPTSPPPEQTAIVDKLNTFVGQDVWLTETRFDSKNWAHITGPCFYRKSKVEGNGWVVPLIDNGSPHNEPVKYITDVESAPPLF